MGELKEDEKWIIDNYISDRRLVESLNPIRNVMKNIWTTEKRIIQNYTDHGVEHSERVIVNIKKLLENNTNVKFFEEEIYLLLLGAYLHDIGMQCDIVNYPKIKEKAIILGAEFKEDSPKTNLNGYSEEDQKEIRDNHHYLSAAWIDYLHKGNDQVLSPDIKKIEFGYVNDLIDVCKFHSKLPINGCPEPFEINPRNRKRLVAAMLRIADELDISNERVNINTVKIFSINPDNSVYWWLHNYTKIDFFSNVICLKVYLHPDDFYLYGADIQKFYIKEFHNKNQPILKVLHKHNINIRIDDDESKVMSNDYVDKLPDDIANELIKMRGTRVLGKTIVTANASINPDIKAQLSKFQFSKSCAEYGKAKEKK